MPGLKLLFLQMAVILVAARLMAAVLCYFGQPEVVGERVAGILLGPSLLGQISAPGHEFALSRRRPRPLYALSQLGLILFMFLVDLDVRPEAARGSLK
jgi:Kef-type K+ transport system membrane component KefB